MISNSSSLYPSPPPSAKPTVINTHISNNIENILATPTEPFTPTMELTIPLEKNRKRKCIHPLKSLSLTENEKIQQKIFKLDVFSVFTHKPNALLQKTKKKRKYSRPSKPATACTTSTTQSSSSIAKPLPSYFNDPNYTVDVSLFKDTKKSSQVIWKGHPLLIDESVEGFALLTLEELKVCSTLRLLPAQYLYIKETLLRACLKGPYKKRDAQGWFRIDVNKTNKVYDWFVTIGWIPAYAENWFEHVYERFSQDKSKEKKKIATKKA